MDDLRDFRSRERLLSITRVLITEGQKLKSDPFLKGIRLFEEVVGSEGNVRSSILDEKNNGVSYRELLIRYLLLLSDVNQGPEIEGILEWVQKVTDELYFRPKPIRFLHSPQEFFNNLSTVISVVDRTQKAIVRRKARPGYRLMQRGKINFDFASDWCTPMILLLRLVERGSTLLEWISSWKCADSIVDNLRNSEFGLGAAIGDKGCRLFMKYAIHYGLIRSSDPKWNENSYTIPIDQNVGRVLMRSGLLFGVMTSETFKSCCRLQSSGRMNLAANTLKGVPFDSKTDTQVISDATRILKLWRSRSRVPKFPILLNALVDICASESGLVPSIGVVDDELMKIGKSYCANTPEDMKCTECPLRKVCYAYNNEPELITQYYCGSGSGTTAAFSF